MSYRTLATKPLNAGLKSVLKRGGHIGLGLSAFAPVLALANPTGGQVIAGQATIAAPSASGMVITQKSQSAIIDWQQFSIGAGQYVQFLQPSSSSVVLNRVIGGSASSILGNLTGNGQVFLVNTNGVYFGKGSSIDTQGFLASTLGISDQNFLAHNYVFDQPGSAGAEIVNQGNITAHHSGYVVLAGDYAENDGVIAAQSGHVILASGSKATLSLNGNSLINFAVNQSTLANYAGVKNTGSILADGGTVIMTADVANLLKSTVVNNTGLVEAHAISNSGGVIQLLASGGNIQNAGTIDVSATRAAQAGGVITLKGDERTTLTDTSNIDATGEGAKGGSVEVSGNTIAMRGAMKLGKGGKLLLDPDSIDIIAGSTGTAGSLGVSAGTGSGGGLTKLGVGFIQTQLNNGVNVDISAHAVIDHSANVKAITATTPPVGAPGTLEFKTAATGHIELLGVDITIAGRLIASAGYVSFGYIQAASASLHAAEGLNFKAATVSKSGAITKYSVKTTNGNLALSGNSIADSGLFAADAVAGSVAIGHGSHSSGIQFVNGNDGVTLVGKSVRATDVLKDTGILTVLASNGSIVLAHGVSGDAITLTDTDGTILAGNLAAYGGNLTVTDSHGHVNVGSMSAAGNIVVTAKNGSITVGKSVTASGTLTLAASAAEGDINIHSGEAALRGAKGITLSGDFITRTGGSPHESLQVIASHGNITATAGFGSGASGSSRMIGRLFIAADGGAVKLGKDVYEVGPVAIAAASLAYTGADSEFVIDAVGSLSLAAPIGTAKAPVNYAIHITDTDGALVDKVSIYTKSSIDLSETGPSSQSGAGLFVDGFGSGGAITLSAKGPITLKGARVGIGGPRPVTISADDGNSKTSTDKLSITASDGSLLIQPEAGSIDFGLSPPSNASNDRSISLHAGADVVLTGNKVHLAAGTEHASVSSVAGALSMKNSVSVTAGRDILVNAASDAFLSGGSEIGKDVGSTKTESLALMGGVSLVAGRDIDFQAKNVNLNAGTASADAEGAATVVAIADVSLAAGRDVILQASNGHSVAAVGGHAEVAAVTSRAKQVASATASAGVSIQAGHDLTLSGGSIDIDAGKQAASGAQVSAAQSGAKATAIAHADTILSAGDAIIVTAHSVSVGAGVGAAGAHGSSTGTAGHHQVTWRPTQVSATGQKAAASLTATANVSLKAGAGGIALDAGSGGLFAAAGGQAALAVQVDAGSLGGKASVDAEAKLSLAASGDVSLTATDNLHVRGGTSAGGVALSLSSSLHGTSVTRSVTGRQAASLHAGAGGTASLKTDISVSITAGGALSLADTKLAGLERLSISAGIRPAASIGVFATGAKAAANVTLDTAVSLSAGKGGLTVETHTNSGGTLRVLAGEAGSGAQIASHASVSADFGAKAGLAIDSRVVLSTKGDLSLAARKEVVVEGGNHGFQSAVVHASSGAATASLQDGVSLTAGGVFGADASSSVKFVAAQHQAQSDSVSAVGTGAKAGLSADGRISINAGGGFNLGAKFFLVSAGQHIGSSADITGSAGGTAALTAEAGISFVGGGNFTLNVGGGGNLRIIGGFGGHDDVTATHGNAALNQDGSVTLTATGNLDLLAPAVTIAAGSGAVGTSDRISVTRGSATVTGLDGITLKAGGEFVASGAASGLSISGGHSAGAHATLSARGAGSKLVMQIAAGVSIAAGSDVSFKGQDGFRLLAGNDLARFADIHASSGAVVTDSANAALVIAAVGNFIASAQSTGLQVLTGHVTGDRDNISVQHGTATLKADAGVHLSAKGSLSLAGDASGSLDATFDAGSRAVLSATAGTITDTVMADLSLTAGGALHAAFAGSLGIGAGSLVGNRGHLTAQGIGGKANLVTDAGVAISAQSISLTAGGSLKVSGGGEAGHSNSGSALQHGTVTETLLAGVSLTASKSIQASLTGAGTSNTLLFVGGSQAGGNMALTAESGGVGNSRVDSSMNLKVTGKGGSVSLTTGTLQTSTVLGIEGGSMTTNDANLSADAATATLAITSEVNVSALGAITLAASHGALQVAAEGSQAGIHVTTRGKGAKGTLQESASVSIKAGTDLALTAANNLNLSVGDIAGASIAAHASSGGVTTLGLDNHLSLTAGGKFSFTLTGGDLIIVASTLEGQGGGAVAQGTASKTNVSVNGSISLTAVGALTETDADVLAVVAGQFPASSNRLSVTSSDGGKAAAVLDASVNIKGQGVSLAHTGSLGVFSSAGVNTGGLTEKGKITVTGGTLAGFAPQGLGTLQQDASVISLESVLSSPLVKTPPILFSPQASGVKAGTADCEAVLLRDDSRCRSDR